MAGGTDRYDVTGIGLLLIGSPRAFSRLTRPVPPLDLVPPFGMRCDPFLPGFAIAGLAEASPAVTVLLRWIELRRVEYAVAAPALLGFARLQGLPCRSWLRALGTSALLRVPDPAGTAIRPHAFPARRLLVKLCERQHLTAPRTPLRVAHPRKSSGSLPSQLLEAALPGHP